MAITTLKDISAEMIETKRIRTRVLLTKLRIGSPVLFIHGNASSATFWEEIMLQLPEGYWGLAPDLRGYGDANKEKLIDATKGCSDWVEDIISILDHYKIKKTHVCAHSLGGIVTWALINSYPDRILSVTQVNPGPPFGLGGTKDEKGTPTYDDFANSGGGIIDQEYAKLMKMGDRSESNPRASPRIIMNTLYWKPPFRPTREEDLLTSVLSEHIGDKQFPGDFVQSSNWPGVAPGKWGPANAVSPKYLVGLARNLINAKQKPKILWVRGSDDLLISDHSVLDVATMAKMGLMKGWPGDEICPAQPFVSQTRVFLQEYKKENGFYSEVVIEGTGHTPFIEKPDEFNQYFHKFLIEHT